jgi:hypothetical protein
MSWSSSEHPKGMFMFPCHGLGVEPWASLQDVRTRVPSTPSERLTALLPDHWQTAQQPSMATPPTSPTDPPVPATDQAC